MRYHKIMIDFMFSNFKWYRKLSGGHWERWWIDIPICDYIWVRNNHGTRPIGAGNLEACEDYNPKHDSNHPYR